jgi:hypothetical protein
MDPPATESVKLKSLDLVRDSVNLDPKHYVIKAVRYVCEERWSKVAKMTTTVDRDDAHLCYLFIFKGKIELMLDPVSHGFAIE